MKRLVFALVSVVALGLVVVSSTHASDWAHRSYSGHGTYAPHVGHGYSHLYSVHQDVYRQRYSGHGTYAPYGGLGHGQLFPAHQDFNGQHNYRHDGQSLFYGNRHKTYGHGHSISTPRFRLRLGH